MAYPAIYNNFIFVTFAQDVTEFLRCHVVRVRPEKNVNVTRLSCY